VVQLIKLGGSVLTDKDGPASVRNDVLDRLAREIATSPEPVVVVHGAGSFGHPLARQAKLAAGLVGPKSAQAAATVHASVRRLNLQVLDALRRAGLSPVTFSPLGSFLCSDGLPGHWNLIPLHRGIELGLTPVTHGDLVLDTARGLTVLSGDQIMIEMARFFSPTRVVFVIDQDGVLSAPPGHAEAELLVEPTLLEVERAQAFSDGTENDATGGMANKLAAARAMVKRGVEVDFVNGLIAGRVSEALSGATTGTRLTPEART